MKTTSKDIALAFWQQNANNCTSIALIKAAIETFGIDNVFQLRKDSDTYIATLRNGHSVGFTDQDLLDSIKVGSFQRSKDQTKERQELYEAIRKYAQLCFAVMVANYHALENTSSFYHALLELSSGANVREVSKYLGLERHASGVFRGGADNKSMMAWLYKHAVYMSEQAYDYYGDVKFNTGRYPKRIKIHETAQEQLLEEVSILDRLRFINVSKYGTFRETGNTHTVPKHVDELIAHLKSNNIKNLLLHFHGGLVSENRGMASAEEFYNNYSTLEGTHPLSIVWETGILEALPQVLQNALTDDTLLRGLVVKTSKYISKKLGIDIELITNGFITPTVEEYASIIQTNTVELTDEELSDLFVDYQHNLLDQESVQDVIYSELADLFSGKELAEELTIEELDRINKDDTDAEALTHNPMVLWYVAKIAARCIKRFASKRGHGVWPTIVEEACREIYLDDFGTEVWQRMKDQAENMWRSNNRRDGLDQFVGRYLTDQLLKNFTSDELNIHVVAHSAGTVAVCEWIKMLNANPAYSSLRFKNIIFLAPACTCELFAETIMKYPTSYESFRMFTMDDRYERIDKLIPLPGLGYLYPRSLLYLISGVLEGRRASDADAFILGLHRHLSQKPPYSSFQLLTKVREHLNGSHSAESRLVLSKTDGSALDGKRSHAIKHGGFSLDKEVIKSIKYILSQQALTE